MASNGFDEDGRPLNAEAARIEIERIRGDRNISAYDEEQLGRTDPDWQAAYRRRILENHEETARYVRRFRFIYELLQNADDASYPEGVKPTVTFRVNATELIVQSNEKGFSLDNVNAICAIGKSSKATNSDTTGEKGLGFKSVFGIAERAHIQSGHWSFYFERKRGDDDAQMVTPIWLDPTESLPPDIRTSCKLHYSDNTPKFHEQLISEFEKLPRTIVFALRQLESVSIVFEHVNGRSDRITFTKDGKLSSDKIQINTNVFGTFGEHKTNTTNLRLFQTSIQDMPTNELRTDTTSTITIAFEVDDTGLPVVPALGQHIFAYLPVQRMPQLGFLIHAEFVLLNSREAVDGDYEWNERLREGVALAFSDFVAKLSLLDDKLAYTWMRYLPIVPIGGFWEPLFEDIKSNLQGKDVLISRKNFVYEIEHMRILPPWFLYEEEPILADTDADIYLSEDYEKDDVVTLQMLGLEEINNEEVVARMKLALSPEAESCVHHIGLDDAWHTAFTVLIDKILEEEAFKQEVLDLEIIPLNNKSWASPTSSVDDNAIYLPYVVEEDSVKIEVPEGLGLRKLHPTATADGERLGFYIRLGITTCPYDIVVPKILTAHKAMRNRNIKNGYLRDLEVLFWHSIPASVHPSDLRIVGDSRNGYQGRHLFFPSEDEFHAQKLLAKTPKADFSNYAFLHACYMASDVRNHVRYQVSWLSWLQGLGVSYFPPLAQSTSSEYTMHPLMKLIARDNPENFIANLKEHWPDYRLDAGRIINDLKDVLVPCQNDTKLPLRATILPTQSLLNESEELGLSHQMPFLQLPSPRIISDAEAWFFLKTFAVTCDLNAEFFLAALHSLSSSTEKHLVPTCAKIYSSMAARTIVREPETLRQTFANQPLIRTNNGVEAWSESNECIWEGPAFLRAIKVLSPVPDYGTDVDVRTFFKTFLQMRDIEYQDWIAELTILALTQNDMSPSLQDELPLIYSNLAKSVRSENADEIRNAFEKTSLIFAKGQWFKPIECLWNCTIEIKGRFPLEPIYPNLGEFFVNNLKVSTMSITVLAGELVRAAETEEPDSDEIKRMVLEFGKLLTADPATKISEQSLSTLRETAFIPVSGPNGREFLSPTHSFHIIDHKRYGEAFEGLARLADFDLEDLIWLRPFFELLQLQRRYLSTHVKEYPAYEEPRPDVNLQNFIKNRAYVLSCCAVTYNSHKYYNKTTSMHESLLETEVFICKRMWTDLKLKQGTEIIPANSNRAVVKIDFHEGRLRIHVPDDEDGLYSCFHTELPQALAKTLGIQDKIAVKVVYRILNDVDKDLDTIMSDEDLHQCPWLEKPIPSQQHSNAILQNGSNALTSQEPTPQETEPERNGSRSSPPVWQQVARNELYKKFLREVVRQARRQRSARRRSLDLAEMNEALAELDELPDYKSFHSAFGGTAYGTFQQNAPEGAAGELFVFELLKSAGVAGFTFDDNWRSGLRNHVRILPDYQGEPEWKEREVSDIMYEGKCPRLMAFLRSHTVHSYPQWLKSNTISTSVNFHIEVKTTSGPCSTPFFMPMTQYRLMRENACDPLSSTPPRNLFVVVRVFNLFTNNIGIQAYIDPWHLREHTLEFTADEWKVMPTRAASDRQRTYPNGLAQE